MRIGEFQFQNLMVNRIPCMILDLRIEEADKPRISRAHQVSVENVVDYVKANTQDFQHPIVLVSDDGTLAFIAAEKLVEVKYFNVVVLEGGVRALSETAKVLIQVST